MPQRPHELLMESFSLETDRRLTRIEVHQEHREESNETYKERADKRLDAIEKRMSLHERAILAIAGILQVILQDKYPKLAAILKGLL